MNHPATRDPLGSRSPGCCYHSWNPQVYPPCRVCQRPVLTLQQCTVRHTPPYVRPSYPEAGQQEERPRRQRSAETPSPRRHVDIIDRRPPSNPYYHTHPPPSSSSGHHLSKSVSAARLGSPGGSLGQRSPGTRGQKPPALETPHRWIGEETKRSLPSHVYKYYLAHTKEYRRQNIKVNSFFFFLEERFSARIHFIDLSWRIFLKILNTCFDFFDGKLSMSSIIGVWVRVWGLRVKFFVRFLQDVHFSCSGKSLFGKNKCWSDSQFYEFFDRIIINSLEFPFMIMIFKKCHYNRMYKLMKNDK